MILDGEPVIGNGLWLWAGGCKLSGWDDLRMGLKSRIRVQRSGFAVRLENLI